MKLQILCRWPEFLAGAEFKPDCESFNISDLQTSWGKSIFKGKSGLSYWLRGGWCVQGLARCLRRMWTMQTQVNSKLLQTSYYNMAFFLVQKCIPSFPSFVVSHNFRSTIPLFSNIVQKLLLLFLKMRAFAKA